jgi:acyl CoA:acetate/3-ketoacid CoA transferase beta subunit
MGQWTLVDRIRFTSNQREENTMPVMKTQCSVSRDEFAAGAVPMTIVIGGVTVGTAMPKEFSTGSFGWHQGGKMNVTVGGKQVLVQVGINLTVIGSKEVP